MSKRTTVQDLRKYCTNLNVMLGYIEDQTQSEYGIVGAYQISGAYNMHRLERFTPHGNGCTEDVSGFFERPGELLTYMRGMQAGIIAMLNKQEGR